jgi:hypothetical protein
MRRQVAVWDLSTTAVSAAARFTRILRNQRNQYGLGP